MSDNDLIQEARMTSLPTPLSLTRRLADRLEAANTRASQLEKALREVARFDTSCDLDAVTCSIIAHDALAGVPDEPATEEKP